MTVSLLTLRKGHGAGGVKNVHFIGDVRNGCSQGIRCKEIAMADIHNFYQTCLQKIIFQSAGFFKPAVE